MCGKVLLRICSTSSGEYCCLDMMMMIHSLTHSLENARENTTTKPQDERRQRERHTQRERRVEGSLRAAAAETRAPSSKQTTTRGTRGASSPSRCLCSSSCLSFSISSTWCLVLEIATHLCSCHLIHHQTRERRSLSDTRASRLSLALSEGVGGEGELAIGV